MCWTNYHGHCNYCDGKGVPEEYILSAIEKGMHSIGFSSHAPVPFNSSWNMPLDRLPSYLSEIEDLKQKYDGQINIFKSLEVDFIANVMGPMTEHTRSLGLDYVIGSVHYLGQLNNGEYWAIDSSFDVFKEGLRDIYNGDLKRLVNDFYLSQYEMLETQSPDIIGHLDKIKMHNTHELLFDESLPWYKELVRHLLELIAKKDCIVEINTKSYCQNGLLFPGPEHFAWLKELKIPVVINSDAHNPNNLTAGFMDVAVQLNQAGIQEVAVLTDKKWSMKPLTRNGIILD
jgi:histidinol-phosphatase (PHP family)